MKRFKESGKMTTEAPSFTIMYGGFSSAATPAGPIPNMRINARKEPLLKRPRTQCRLFPVFDMNMLIFRSLVMQAHFVISA